MSELETISNRLKLYNAGEAISINLLRIKCEDLIDYYEERLHSLVGERYSENDIIIEARLNNDLYKARTLYNEIMININK